MTLTMVQLTPNMNRLIGWAHRKCLLVDRGGDDLGYALHAALAAAFGREHAPKPFALVRPPRGRRPSQLLGYISSSADTLRDQAAACAEPIIAEAIGLDTLAAKRMPEAWRPGARYGFEVRVRPMIRTDRDGDRTRTRERDVYLAAVEGFAPGEGPSRGEVYTRWLSSQLSAGGAGIEHVTLGAFRLIRTLRRNRDRLVLVPDPARAERMGGAAGAPDATFTGTLRVEDGDRFAALLARGVGRHRAFGFGMLLLRPA